MRLTIWLFVALTAGAPIAAAAKAVTPLCAQAKGSVEADGALSGAVEAALGPVDFTATADDCQFPLKLLRYASADVLLLQDGVPGQGCADCGALLSAIVIQRANGVLTPVAKFREFAKLGAFTRVADVTPITIDGDDGFVAASGSVAADRLLVSLEFFAFHNGALNDLDPTPPVIVYADNRTAKNPSSFQATWFFDPIDKGALVVDYKIQEKAAERVERAVWRLQAGHLALTRGKVPPETDK